MDEPKYIESYSDKELEAELAERKRKATTLKPRNVELTSPSSFTISGVIVLFENQAWPDYVVFENKTYRFTGIVSFAGGRYEDIGAIVVSKKA